jgi:hypothetical protein
MEPSNYNSDYTDRPEQPIKSSMSGFLPRKDNPQNLEQSRNNQDEPTDFSQKASQEYETPYDRPTQPEEAEPIQDEPQKDPNAELLEELKNNRDNLRGNSQSIDPLKSKKRLKKILLALLAAILLGAIAFIFIKPSTKTNAPVQRVAFALPADIENRAIEERSAITIIRLARDNKSDEITKNWLGVKDVSATNQDFKDLISSYADSADGNNIEVVEKKVGKHNLGVEGSGELNAVSFVFKSKYFEHTNSLYTKINLYEQADKPGTWKLYLFEFKAEQNDQPLKAEL